MERIPVGRANVRPTRRPHRIECDVDDAWVTSRYGRGRSHIDHSRGFIPADWDLAEAFARRDEIMKEWRHERAAFLTIHAHKAAEVLKQPRRELEKIAA